MRTALDGREIVVIDDFFSGAVLEHFARDVDFAPFLRQEEDRTGFSPHRTWVSIFKPDDVRRQPYVAALARHIDEQFPGERFELFRAYASSLSFGEMQFSHRDAPAASRDLTAIVYLTDGWQREWGGETIFFSDDGEARIAVSPKPGRLVLFRGGIEHRASPPMRDCPRPRLTIVIKFEAQP